MRKITILASVLLICFFLTPVSMAGDFDWLEDFNVKAEADPTGFKARLETRFKIGGTDVNALLATVDDPADAYMVLRLGELSGRPTGDVIRKYQSGKGKGWGALAKSLGIKPGSKAFKALKNGDEFKGSRYTNKNKAKKGKNKKG